MRIPIEVGAGLQGGGLRRRVGSGGLTHVWAVGAGCVGGLCRRPGGRWQRHAPCVPHSRLCYSWLPVLARSAGTPPPPTHTPLPPTPPARRCHHHHHHHHTRPRPRPRARPPPPRLARRLARPQLCEQRDPKGLYKAARAGKIKNFTGIDDPCEWAQHGSVGRVHGPPGCARRRHGRQRLFRPGWPLGRRPSALPPPCPRRRCLSAPPAPAPAQTRSPTRPRLWWTRVTPPATCRAQRTWRPPSCRWAGRAAGAARGRPTVVVGAALQCPPPHPQKGLLTCCLPAHPSPHARWAGGCCGRRPTPLADGDAAAVSAAPCLHTNAASPPFATRCAVVCCSTWRSVGTSARLQRAAPRQPPREWAATSARSWRLAQAPAPRRA